MVCPKPLCDKLQNHYMTHKQHVYVRTVLYLLQYVLQYCTYYCVYYSMCYSTVLTTVCATVLC